MAVFFTKRHLVMGGGAAVTTGAMAISAIVLSTQAIADYGSVTATTAVNIRQQPSTSSAVLGVLYVGNSLKQVGPITNGWVPVSYGSRTAYVSANYIVGARDNDQTPPSTPGPTGTAWTTTDLNVRSGPSTSYRRIGLLSKGTKVQLTGLVSGQFSQIRFNDERAWVATQYLARTQTAPPTPPPSAGKVRATADLLVRHRNGSATGAADIPAGSVLDTTGQKTNAFTEVIWKGSRVWVNSRYIVSVPSSTIPGPTPAPKPIGTQYTTTELNVRSGPSTSYAVLTTLMRGTAVQVTGTVKNGFAAIVYNGATRWVSAQYLTDRKPSNPTPNPNPGEVDLTGSIGLEGLEPNARNIVNVIARRWGLTTFYGVRPDPLPDHPSGHAVDAMIPNYRSASANAMGWQIANYLRANARTLGVQYVIFDQRIWNIARDREGWRWMSDRGGDTANHKDHVHVTTMGM